MAKQVLDIRFGKGFSLAQSNEHLRVAYKGAYSKNMSHEFDPTRVGLDFEVAKGGVIIPVNRTISIPSRIKANLMKRGIKDPNEGKAKAIYRTAINIILGGDREVMRSMAFGNQEVNFDHGADNSSVSRNKRIEEWALDMYKFACDEFGEENVVAFVVHLDETNPHIHCTVLPDTYKGKLSLKQTFGRTKDEFRRKVVKLHDDLAKYNERYGLNRGENVDKTGAKHRTTRGYLDDLIKQKEDEVQQKEMTSKQLDIKIKSLQTKIHNLEGKISELEREQETLEEQIAKGIISRVQGEEKVEEIKRQIATLNEQLKKRKMQLQQTTEQLQQKMDNIGELEKMIKEREKDLTNITRPLEQQAIHNIKSILLSVASVDFQKRINLFEETKRYVSPEEAKFLDKTAGSVFLNGSWMDEIVQNGNDIVRVAASLFLGYVAQATQIAQSAGGGGGPESGWGRKKDEDDDRFSLRCIFMGMKMIHHSPSAVRKKGISR